MGELFVNQKIWRSKVCQSEPGRWSVINIVPSPDLRSVIIAVLWLCLVLTRGPPSTARASVGYLTPARKERYVNTKREGKSFRNLCVGAHLENWANLVGRISRRSQSAAHFGIGPTPTPALVAAFGMKRRREGERPEKGRQSQCDRFVNHFVKRLVTLILWIISVLKHSKVSSRESLAESLYCSPAYLMPESGSSMCQRLTMMLHFQFVSCPPVWGAGRSAPILRSLVGHATRGLQYSSAFLCFPPPVHQSRSEAIWS